MKHILVLLILISLWGGNGFSQDWKSRSIREEYRANPDEQLRVRLLVDAGVVKISSSNSRTRGEAIIRSYRKGLEPVLDFDRDRNRLTLSLLSDGFEFLKKQENTEKWGEVRITLPTDVHIDLNAKVKAGQIDFQLGGIRIADFSLHNWAGEVTIDFARENKDIMNSFEVASSFGAVSIENLGNAKFEQAEIDCGIGDLYLDLKGTHLHGAYAKIDLDIGQTTINVPRHLGIKLAVDKSLFLSYTDEQNVFSKEGRYYYSQNYSNEGETLFLKISPGWGELKVTSR